MCVCAHAHAHDPPRPVHQQACRAGQHVPALWGEACAGLGYRGTGRQAASCRAARAMQSCLRPDPPALLLGHTCPFCPRPDVRGTRNAPRAHQVREAPGAAAHLEQRLRCIPSELGGRRGLSQPGGAFGSQVCPLRPERAWRTVSPGSLGCAAHPGKAAI